MKKIIFAMTSLVLMLSCNTTTTNENEPTEPAISNEVTMKKVNIKSEGLNLVGNLFYPAGDEKGKTYPAVIVSGSWTTVKEQMAGLYAKRFAENGFITLAFDFRNYGESEGVPRAWENPEMKIQDIIPFP